ncbi:MAG TPA: hypothetical protein VHB21_20650, partial [Minicystis sp.]|nr:hypothetical protein [Minicystis sp.]
PAQHDKIAAILARHEPEVTAVTREMQPKLKPVFHEVETEIRAELTPEQAPKFDELVKRFHERHDAAH